MLPLRYVSRGYDAIWESGVRRLLALLYISRHYQHIFTPLDVYFRFQMDVTLR